MENYIENIQESSIPRIATFDKVPFSQFLTDFKDCNPNVIVDETAIQDIYNNIKLPKRSTSGSAGYDFYLPYDITLRCNESTVIPTGIRVEINDGWVLSCYPRSGLGFKYRLSLDNTVGIIDADYYGSDNYGHIKFKIHYDNNQSELPVEQGKGIAQGIFTQFGITTDDDVSVIRNGGIGSTDETPRMMI